ncbi:MAG: OmpA family protein, partial [Bacteroidales bacterium]
VNTRKTNKRRVNTSTKSSKKTPPRVSSRRKSRGPIVRNKEWGQPINLGNLVNTPGREVFPMWIDANTFSFSSDGKIGYGGLDIYVARLDSTKEKVEHVSSLEPPINSSYDDYSLLLDKGFDEVFFVSNRYNGPGKTDDIYAFKKTSGLVKITGAVFDQESGTLLKDYFVCIKDVQTGKMDTVYSEKNGTYSLNRQHGSNYDIGIRKDAYFSEFQSLHFPDMIASLPIILSANQNFYLHKDTLLYKKVNPIDRKIFEDPLFANTSTKTDSLALLDAELLRELALLNQKSNLDDSTMQMDASWRLPNEDTENMSTLADYGIDTDFALDENLDTSTLAENTENANLSQESIANNSNLAFQSNKIFVESNLPPQNLSKLLNDEMAPSQIVNTITKNRKDYPSVDERFVRDYKSRINDPNRRNRLQVVPPGVKCDACEEKQKQRNIDEPFYIRSGDDKALITLKDNAGNTSYVDIAPNAAYSIEVTNMQFAGGAPTLPQNVEISDVRKTVTTKDYVLYECAPKLSEIDDEVYINTVYYDLGKSELIKDATRELDRLIIVALKNPMMQFEVSAHADERGSDEINNTLTEKRLESVVNYVSKKGFDVNRIAGRAYGKTQPLIKNARTEEEHRLNRRTTFRLFLPEEELRDVIKEENVIIAEQIERGEIPEKMPYPIEEKQPEKVVDIRYRVQLGAFRNPIVDPLNYYGIIIENIPSLKLNYYYDEDGMYKYSVGNYTSLEQARKVAKEILDLGREIYIAAYYKGERVTVSEAMAITKRKRAK